MKRFLSVLAPVALYGLSNEAHAALSCKDIIELHSYNTKSEIIIRWCGTKAWKEELECLKRRMLPKTLLPQHKNWQNKSRCSRIFLMQVQSSIALTMMMSVTLRFRRGKSPRKNHSEKQPQVKQASHACIFSMIFGKGWIPWVCTEVQFYWLEALSASSCTIRIWLIHRCDSCWPQKAIFRFGSSSPCTSPISRRHWNFQKGRRGLFLHKLSRKAKNQLITFLVSKTLKTKN